MSIQETLNNAFTNWMEGEGPEARIAISSRVRLARNLADQPFPHRMSQESGQTVVGLVQDVIADPVVQEKLGPLFYVSLNELSSLDRQVLMEKHLISPQHAQTSRRQGA
jgi:protein arginine kinase